MAAEYRIYPSLGVARVGNSPEYYFAPRTYCGLPTINPDGTEPTTEFRDSEGRLKRQAAQFFVYKVDPDSPHAEPKLCRPGDGDIAKISWTVHLANKKSGWYTFEQLQGIDGYGDTHPKRNANITDPDDRLGLIIDPGPHTITEPSGHAEFARDKGAPGYHQTFPPRGLKPHNVDTLGEMGTDGDGHLFVLGGYGCSGTLDEKPVITAYANNDRWWDDTSDGPVTATVTLTDGTEIPIAQPAWVVAAPPAYAPQIPNVLTLYDVWLDTAVRHFGYRPDLFADGKFRDDYRPCYKTEIEPFLKRPFFAQYVAGITAAYHDFNVEALGEDNETSAKLRKYFFERLRAPGDVNVYRAEDGKLLMPWLAGNNPITTDDVSKYCALTETLMFLLSQWSKGLFVNDTEPAQIPEPDPHTKASLENCVGGPFCPGIEMTWIAYLPELFSAPFQIKPNADLSQPLGLGDDMQTGQQPGDLTKRMALPWQADFNECSDQTIKNAQVENTLPWWPSQRPLMVQIRGDGGPLDIKTVPWSRGLPSDTPPPGENRNDKPGDLAMVSQWPNLGFLVNVGTDFDPEFLEVQRNEDAFNTS
jgi:hypothetical protein